MRPDAGANRCYRSGAEENVRVPYVLQGTLYAATRGIFSAQDINKYYQ